MSETIRANPGFWLHWVPVPEDVIEFIFYSSPIIGWRVEDGKDAKPITVFSFTRGLILRRFDDAIEYPDGSCVDDNGTRHATVDDWLEEVERSFNEAREDEER